jgi:branched-chain amino acid transport system substrate-binding protein
MKALERKLEMRFAKFTQLSIGLLATALLPLSQTSVLGAIDEDRTGITTNEIVVGSCGPLSGQQKVRGTETVAGGKLYFDYVNEQGGVNGRKIKLLTCDDKYTPEGASECFKTIIKDKAFLGTCFMGTSAASELVQLADANRFPMVGFSTGGKFIVEPVHPYAFQVRPSYGDEGEEIVNGIWGKLAAKKIVIVHQKDAFGASCRAAVFRAREAKKLQPAVAIGYERLSTDIEPILQQVKKETPDAVIIGGGGDMLVNLTKSLRALNIPVATFSSSSDLLVKEAGKAADGTLITQCLPFTEHTLPAVQLYDKLCSKAGLTASTSGFEGYLMARTVVEGLKRAGKDPTRSGFLKVMEAMHGVDIGLGAHKLSFSPTNHSGLKGESITWSIVHNGQLVTFSDWAHYKKAG